MVGGLRDVITCAEFQIEIFMGYDFTGGRIFDFPIDFSMDLTTVQRYCAACDATRLSAAKQPPVMTICDGCKYSVDPFMFLSSLRRVDCDDVTM